MSPEPKLLGEAISELIRVRGLARRNTDRQLGDAWVSAAGTATAAATRVGPLKRGVLQVAVRNAALLNELVSFRQQELLEKLQQELGASRIKSLKFKLQGELS